MNTAVSKSGKSAIDFKQIMKDTAGIGTSVVGFAAGHMAFGVAPASLKSGMKGILAAVLLVLVGGFIAVKATTVEPSQSTSVKRNSMIGFGTGLGTYGVIKAINIGFGMMPVVGSAPVATAGFEGIPDGLRNVVNKIFPNLGDADPIPYTQVGDLNIYEPGTELNAVDTEYEFVTNGTDDLEIPIMGTDEFTFGEAAESTFNAISGVGQIQFAA